MKPLAALYQTLQLGRAGWVVMLVVCTVILFSRCNNEAEVKQDAVVAADETLSVKYEDFAGPEKCASCHKAIYDTHIQTAHFLTGQTAEEKNIHGSFKKGANAFSYTPDILLSMEKRDSGLFQVVFFKGQEKKAMKFDLVIGSGVMGQSFLSWRKDKLFQLPITYFTAADRWSNSPGFPADRVLIDRPITARCLECHASYAVGTSGPVMEPVGFDHQKLLLGVNCEKCHGPAAKHVQYQAEHPQEKKAKYIVNPSSLSRQLQLDVCSYCHGGNIQKTKPSFQFTAGKNLNDYFVTDTSVIDIANSGNMDVHGNQLAFLKASQCFQMSNMTCNTCHNTHENQRNQPALFSQKCLSCHHITDAKFKSPTHNKVVAIQENCIDCHMPAQPSKAIAVNLEGEDVPRASLIRSHFISIYQDQIKSIKSQMNNNQHGKK